MSERGRLVLAGCPGGRLDQFESIARQLSCDLMSASCYDDLLAFTTGYGCIVSELLVGNHSLLQSLAKLIQDRPTFKVIVVSENIDVSISVRAMKAGAFNVLTPQSGITTLMLAIHEAVIAAAETNSTTREEDDLLRVVKQFNPGEMAVLQMVLAGLQNREIADKLGVSARTVELRRQKILQTTGAANAVRLAYVISRSERVWHYVSDSQSQDLADADTVPEMNVPKEL